MVNDHIYDCCGYASDAVLGRESPIEKMLSPSRSIFRPQLAENAIESIVNLLTPFKKRCSHL